MKNKIFTRIIITTLLCAFLTLNVGKVTRVSAVGTTAAIAGTAFILTGAVYLSYVALTQGEIVLPAAQDLHDYLGSIGRKVSQYPSGSAAYQDIYQGLVRSPVGNVIDGVWTWTQDRIKDFVNDFSDTRIIQSIAGYEAPVDTSLVPRNGYSYDFTFVTPNPYVEQFGVPYTSLTFQWFCSGPDILMVSGNNATFVKTNFSAPIRNTYNPSGNYYEAEYFANGIWNSLTSIQYGLGRVGNGSYVMPASNLQNYIADGYSLYNLVGTLRWSYPAFPNEVIYNTATGETTDLVEVTDTEFKAPRWVDPDNENRPIIPWVPIPDIPTGVPTPPGYQNPPQWGFPLAELLDLLEELAEGLMEIDAIARLINEYAGQHGDNYYLEYNDGDTNYYTYYQPTVFDNDTEYVTYNINVSEQEDTIPVDLNTISLYSNNRYLEQIKQSAINGSSIIRDLAVFWYDVDPEVTYIALGICIIVLLGAFTGKLGHS